MNAAAAGYTLAEELVLLAIDPRSGRLVEKPSGSLAHAVAGAVLSAALTSGHLTVTYGQVYAGSDSGDPLTSSVLDCVRALNSPQRLGYWVNALAMRPFDAQARTLAMLTSGGAVAIEKGRHPLLPRPARYRVAERARGAAIASLRHALTVQGELSPDQASLIVLASSCGAIRVVDRHLRAVARQRVRSVSQQVGVLAEALAEQGQLAYGDLIGGS